MGGKSRICEICGVRERHRPRFFANFPIDEQRCRTWVQIVGKEDLVHIPIEKLNQVRFVCGDHFKAKDFNKKGNRLKKRAYPKLQLSAQPLSDQQLKDFPQHVASKVLAPTPTDSTATPVIASSSKMAATTQSIMSNNEDFIGKKKQERPEDVPLLSEFLALQVVPIEPWCLMGFAMMVGADNPAQTSEQAKKRVESADTVERSDANCPINPTETSSMSGKRLTGSAKSRIKALRGLGVAHEEALQLSAKSFAELKKMGYKFESSQTKPKPKSAKRPGSEEESPLGNTSKKPRVSETPSIQPQPPQPCNELRSQLRVGIKDSKPMSDAQLGSLCNTILQKIATLEMGEGPKFKGYSYKPGWLLITCSDQRSKAWLEQITPTLKPWPEASLGIIPENELPKPNIGMVFIPEIDDSMVKQSLSLIYAQNQGLHTELWKILHTKVEKSGVMVTLSLDDKSLENLKKKGLKANLGFREVQFRLKGQPKTQQPETQSTKNPQPQSANPTPPSTITHTSARKLPSGPKRATPSTSNPSPGPSGLQRPCSNRGGYRGNNRSRGGGNGRGHQGHNSAQRRGK